MHDLAVSIDDWEVAEAAGDLTEHVTTDGESWLTARGVLRVQHHGAADGRTSLTALDQGFLLLGSADHPPSGSRVEVTGLLYVEAVRMPMFGRPNPRAWPLRRPWRVVALRREILSGPPRDPSAARDIVRLPAPEDVGMNSYYFADLTPA